MDKVHRNKGWENIYILYCKSIVKAEIKFDQKVPKGV